MRKKLAVLISDTGTGSNLQAIIEAIKNKNLNAEITIVLSDTAKSLGIEKAKKENIQTLVLNKKDNLTKLFESKYTVDYIVLAGWKQIIPDNLIDSYKNKILNLHPGLIPDKINGVVKNPDQTKALWNRGKLADVAIREFLRNKLTYGGSSVHFLSHKFDYGPVLGRTFEKIVPSDTIESFYKRLKKKENLLYVEVLQKLCNE